MKILILVLSYNEPPFDKLMRTQRTTFDSIEVEGIRTVYYFGGLNKKDNPDIDYIIHSNTTSSCALEFDCTDSYYYMSDKFKKCLEVVGNEPYDLIFRTNSSSYVNKKALVEFAKTLPCEKLYAGWTFEDSNDFGGLCVSGAGIWLSRDTAKILMEQIDPNFEQEEDVYCGRILRRNGITAIDDKSRYDVQNIHDYIPLNRYHYRCKTGNRLVDCHNMISLHKKLMAQ